MDWEKIGQAFSGAGNVLAAGLQERWQRQQAMGDWYQKQLALDTLQKQEEQRKREFEIGKLDYTMIQDAAKKEFETNPELIPIWQKAQAGDEQAQTTLKKYTAVKYMMDNRQPLSSEQIAELGDLPPQTRHVIINRHLNTLLAEQKRLLDEEKTKAETKYREALAKKAEQDMKTGGVTPTQLHAESVKAVEGRQADIEKRVKARDEKQAVMQQLEMNLLTLDQTIGEKIRQRATVKGGDAKGAVDIELGALQQKKEQMEKQKKRLEDDLSREAKMLQKSNPELFGPAEAEAASAVPLSPEAQQFLNALPEADRAELYAAIRKRKDVPQEVIIREYVRYKKLQNPQSPPQGRGF